MKEMLKLIAENGLAIVICCMVIESLKKYFSGKIKVEQDSDIAKVKQDQELFSVFTKLLSDERVRMNEFKDEFSELRKTVISGSYMSPIDFETLLKLKIELSLLKLEQELISIIKNNNINPNTIDLTKKKVENSIEMIINLSISTIHNVNFRKDVVKIMEDNFREMKIEAKKLYIEPYKEYSTSDEDNLVKCDKAIRSVKETTKYLTNKIITVSQGNLESINY